MKQPMKTPKHGSNGDHLLANQNDENTENPNEFLGIQRAL